MKDGLYSIVGGGIRQERLVTMKAMIFLMAWQCLLNMCMDWSQHTWLLNPREDCTSWNLVWQRMLVLVQDSAFELALSMSLEVEQACSRERDLVHNQNSSFVSHCDSQTWTGDRGRLIEILLLM